MGQPKIDKVDWQILDALSNDYESVEQIQTLILPTTVSQEEIIERLHRLHKENYVFLTLNMKFDRNALMEEIEKTKNRRYWFGRTETGYLAWEKYAHEYSEESE